MSRKKNIIALDPRQCKAARGLLDWKQEDLAQKINASKKTITDFEQRNRNPQKRTIIDIIRAFEDVGIEFKNNGKISVSLKNHEN